MSTPNTLPESSQEEAESSNKVKSKDLSYLKDVSKKCARKKLWDDNWDFIKDVDFYNKFRNKTYNKKHFIEDLKKQLSWDDLKDLLRELDNTDENNIDILFDSFSREINKIWFSYDRKKEKLEKIIKERYNLEWSWNTQVSNALIKLDSNWLDKILYSSDELDDFVKINTRTISKKTRDLTDIKKIFEYFSFNSVDDFRIIIDENIKNNPALKELWEEKIFVTLTTISNKIKSWEDIDVNDISDMFSYGIFGDEQKKLFIKIFLPTISIQELIDLWIITSQEAEIKKKDVLKKYLSEKNNEEINDDNKDYENLLNDIDFDNIDVSTNDYINSHMLILEKSEKLHNLVSKSFNRTKEEIKEKLLSQILTLDMLKKKVLEDHNITRKIKGWREAVDKIGNWVIFKFNILKDENSLFYEVSDFSDDWKFKWKNRSLSWRYNSSSEVSTEPVEYLKLFETFSSEKLTWIEIISKEELKSKFESGEIKEEKLELWEPWKLELSKYKEEIKSKIEQLKLLKKAEDLEKDDDYKELLRMKEKLDDDNALDDKVVKEELNNFLLKSRIDEIDPNWNNYWIKEWVSFKIWSGDDAEIYTITHVNQLWKKIEIKTPFWEMLPPLTFDQFYKWFKQNKWKISRFSDNSQFSWLIDTILKDSKLSSKWWDFEFKDNNIMKKWQEKITYPYLVQDKKSIWKSNKLVKIYDTIWSGPNQMVKISLWEVVEKDSKIKWKDWKPLKDETYETWGKKYVTVAFLENYIKENELRPKSLTEEKKEWDKVNLWDAPKWGFFKWFLSNKSIHEIMGWLKMWFDEFKNHLKSWNEEHAAKVALATWWKFLPVEVKLELKSRVETAEKKHMTEAVDRLKAVDTPDAINLIYRRLTFRNTEEYKKEAAMIFMLEKYWNLYNKNYTGKPFAPLNSKKWEFLWFKALSWNRWDVTKDPLYQEVKAECEKDTDGSGRTRNFTEEELIWRLMKKQCSIWYNWIHRRSRLHKEVEKLKKSWIQEEINDWFKKWNDTRNPQDIIIKWVDELKAGSPSNCAGRWKKLVDRWDDMATMNTIPMILIYSWLALTVPEDLNKEIKWMVEEWRCIPFARFISYPKDIKLAMKTIRVLSKKIQQRKPDLYPTIWDEAEKMYQNFDKWTKNERDRVQDAINFFQKWKWTNWKSYSSVLTRAMYMLADWNYTSDDSELNSLLLIEKEKPWEDWKILKDYFNNQVAYIDNIKITDDYFNDALKGAWLSSLSYIVHREVLKQESWGWFKIKSWPPMADEIKKEIEATKKRKYSNEEDRRIWLKYYLKNIFAWLVESHQTKVDAANKLFEWVGALNFFPKRWINFQRVYDKGLNQKDILETTKWDSLFDEFVSNIINDSWWLPDTSYNIFSILQKKDYVDS